MFWYRRLSTFFIVYKGVRRRLSPICWCFPALFCFFFINLHLVCSFCTIRVPWVFRIRMSLSEITEEKDDDEIGLFADPEAQKERIRRIIEYQKSLHQSSSSLSSLSSSSASCSSFSSARRSSSLFGLMKVGNTSLSRLFDMEHTSLGNHFEDFSGSSIVKPILLWGSDTDNENETRHPWESIKQLRLIKGSRIGDGQDKFASDGSFLGGDYGFRDRDVRIGARRLTKTKSFRRLPGFGLWRCKGFRFRLRLRRLRIAFSRRRC